MKRARIPSSNDRARKVTCTVSAAALMLGVSHAATVGFNFQNDWSEIVNGVTNGSALQVCYTGKAVTAMAFGVNTNGWQNLAPIPTGYNFSGVLPGPFTNNEVIDTTTATNGLHPLPNGSLNLTWTAVAANFSGFAGYDPRYYGFSYGLASTSYKPNPGAQEVYAGFLRDEAILPSSIHPTSIHGYSVTLTGLRSVWTNTPYVIELVSASDGANMITNAYIASVTSTQAVTYDITNASIDIIGGLSTISGPWTDDSITIWGAPAVKTTGYQIASSIAGFIITDKPVVSMSPHQVVVCGGDTVAWSAYAVGVAPLSYQWRKNGLPISGATTLTLGITNAGIADIGTYDLVVTNLYGTAISSPVTIGDEISTSPIANLVQDSNPNGPEQDGLNNGATWLASSTDSASVTRNGVMSFAASGSNQITVVAATNFNAASGTIMFWMRSSGLVNPAGNPATILDRLSGTGTHGNGAVIVQNPSGTVEFIADVDGNRVAGVASSIAISDNKWHLFAVTYDRSSGGASAVYIDGALDQSSSGNDWSWPAGQQLEWGFSHDTTDFQPYNGQMDDVRFYNRVLSASEITAAHGGGVVDANALVMRLDFTTAPGLGLSLTWRATDVILQSANSAGGPWTDLSGAVSPYKVGIQNAAKLYRYRGHTPVVIISNPYLM